MADARIQKANTRMVDCTPASARSAADNRVRQSIRQAMFNPGTVASTLRHRGSAIEAVCSKSKIPDANKNTCAIQAMTTSANTSGRERKVTMKAATEIPKNKKYAK